MNTAEEKFDLLEKATYLKERQRWKEDFEQFIQDNIDEFKNNISKKMLAHFDYKDEYFKALYFIHSQIHKDYVKHGSDSQEENVKEMYLRICNIIHETIQDAHRKIKWCKDV
jgi:hypothetical protein